MPSVLTSVLDRFADHALDVPDPRNTVRHQVPSACGECHRERSPEDLAQSGDVSGQRCLRELRRGDRETYRLQGFDHIAPARTIRPGAVDQYNVRFFTHAEHRQRDIGRFA